MTTIDELRSNVQAPVKAESPFPLTDIQQAYWIGEQDIYRLNTSAFLYRCLVASELDVARLQQALLSLVRMHPALRTCFLADGTQQVKAAPQNITIPVTDLRGPPLKEQHDAIAARKTTLEDELPAIGGVPQVTCFVDHLDDGYYIHFLFRLIALDGSSIVLFFSELAAAYAGMLPVTDPICGYDDFVHAQLAAKDTPTYQRSLQYWKNRISEMPQAPDLPIVDHEAIPNKSRFRRMQFCLDQNQAAYLGVQARRCGVTINALLCTAYADVLRRWSRNASFTLNVLVSQRPGGAPRFARLMGNFSNTLLLEVSAVDGGFSERAINLQRQLYRDMEHAQVSGVEVIRLMHRAGDSLPAMPVVFASTLGYETTTDAASHCDLSWAVQDGGLHTPQVWLDHQAYMDGERLVLNWDVVEGVFQLGVVEQMFATYTRHLQAILAASFPSEELLLPALSQQVLQPCLDANDTAKPLPRGVLHDFFRQSYRRHPDNTAIVASDRVLSYADMWSLTTRLGAKLRATGVGRNDLVAVLSRRGWRQVTAAVSVVQSGGAYLPVDSDLPQSRQSYLVGQKGVKVLLAERALLDGLSIPAQVQVIALEDCLPDGDPGDAAVLESIQKEADLAYVIFTSGSTGNPKGVAIDHRGAVNTIQDVIARFGLTADDRVIGISAFNFDLSVYDIFATLGTGATLIIPPYSATPAPEDWRRCVSEHRVTVWNTVPALLEMQLEYCGHRASVDLASLRLVMLSGDWIPISLPGRLAAAVPQAALISLGGATEASIWSNYFIVEKVDPTWKSIPYGWPLSNQSFHVLGQHLQPAPIWVPGELYIGGIGLAQGYYDDPERTARSFIYHPQTGERLYRTGDLGRFHPSGRIEFLGRNDNQVKIRGFRIELGEIEAALERCPAVRGGAAVVRPVGHRDKQLVAFYVPTASGISCDEHSIRAHLEKLLPEYMVPARLVAIDHLPVTPNGKVNRAALLAAAMALESGVREKVAPGNEVEKELAAMWKALLECGTLGIHDKFFEVGGTSLMAVRLLNSIEVTFGRRIPLASLLRHGTIAAQAVLLTAATDSVSAKSPAVTIRDGEDGLLVLVHPVGGNVLCYRQLVEMVPEGIAIIGMQSPGDGIPRTISALAASYVDAALPRVRSDRPVYLLGWSMGGVIAHEMARLLESAGMPATWLTMIDSWMGIRNNTPDASLDGMPLLRNFVKDFLDGASLPNRFDEIEALADDDRIDAAIRLLRDTHSTAGRLSRSEFASLLDEHRANFNALIRHRPAPVHTRIHQFRAMRTSSFPLLEPFECAVSTGDGLFRHELVEMEEDHFSIFRGTALRGIIDHMFCGAEADIQVNH